MINKKTIATLPSYSKRSSARIAFFRKFIKHLEQSMQPIHCDVGAGEIPWVKPAHPSQVRIFTDDNTQALKKAEKISRVRSKTMPGGHDLFLTSAHQAPMYINSFSFICSLHHFTGVSSLVQQFLEEPPELEHIRNSFLSRALTHVLYPYAQLLSPGGSLTIFDYSVTQADMPLYDSIREKNEIDTLFGGDRAYFHRFHSMLRADYYTTAIRDLGLHITTNESNGKFFFLTAYKEPIHQHTSPGFYSAIPKGKIEFPAHALQPVRELL